MSILEHSESYYEVHFFVFGLEVDVDALLVLVFWFDVVVVLLIIVGAFLLAFWLLLS